MSRKQSRPRLSVTALENRTVPTLWGQLADLGAIDWNNLPVFEQVPDHLTGSIAFDQGVVTATGTGLDDVITVDLDIPVLTTFAFQYPGGDIGGLFDRIKVFIADPAGNVRTNTAGEPLSMTFRQEDVFRVDVRANGGDDRVFNRTGKTMDAEGGVGNDTIQGGGGLDFLNGDDDSDSLLGGNGTDVLSGDLGADVLRGEAGNDLLDGRQGNDFLDGGSGDDNLNGGLDRDLLTGGTGDDELNGGDGFSAGDGNDTLLGDAGNDLLRGEGGDDILFGGDGNDRLYGGDGNDSLSGENGNDGLFGGAGKDTLRGGAGSDRFLRWTRSGNSTTLKDKATSESLTTFKGTTTQQVAKNNGINLRYAPSEWTFAEIEAVDAGLGWLHAEVGNSRMLKRKDGKDMTFAKWGPYIPYNTTDGVNDAAETQANIAGAGFIGFNHNNGTISFVRVSATNPDSAIRLVVHELAHNWDGENAKWTEWLGLSGWVKTTTPGTGQTLSRDGEWVYDSTAAFARDYGKTNPYEDFSTAFEALYQLKTGTLPAADLVALTPKLNFLGLFISSLG